MGGEGRDQGATFSHVTMEQRIAADHPIGAIRAMVDAGAWCYVFSHICPVRSSPQIAKTPS